jgi:hypothetical protein
MGTFRVMYNQDSSNLFYVTKESLTPAHVDAMVDEVADGGGDTFLVNVNAQKVNYPSRVWENYWHDFRPDDRSYYGLAEDMDVQGRRHLVSQMQTLAQQCDYLERALGRCKSRGLKAGVSVRMNDMHDVPWPKSHLFSQFYRDHPEFYLPDIPIRAWASRGLNYEYKEVRDYFLLLIREVIEDYELDVLELDFLRFTAYFDRVNITQHCETMTGFLKDVRKLIDGSGKSVELLCRIAATPAGACGLGFDVRGWGGLVDGVVIGMFLNTGWELPIDHYRELVGDDVALYASSDYFAARWEGLPGEPLSTNGELLRGFAAGYDALGADGVEMFNFFCSREGSAPIDPAFDVLGEMRDKKFGNARRHLLTAGINHGESDLAVQVPVAMDAKHPRRFEMVLAVLETDRDRTLILILDGDVKRDDLWVCVNDVYVGCAVDVVAGVKDVCQSFYARFQLPSECVVQGRNQILIRNEGEPVTVLGLDVRVG